MRIDYDKYIAQSEKAVSLKAIRDDLSDRVRDARLDHTTAITAAMRGLDFGLERSTLMALGVTGRDRSAIKRHLTEDPAGLYHIFALNGDGAAHIVKAFMDSKSRLDRLEQRFAEVDRESAQASSLLTKMKEFIISIDGVLPV